MGGQYEREKEGACAETVVGNGHLCTWRGVSLHPVASRRECAERAMTASDMRMFLAFKGHPHLLEDVQ